MLNTDMPDGMHYDIEGVLKYAAIQVTKDLIS